MLRNAAELFDDLKRDIDKWEADLIAFENRGLLKFAVTMRHWIADARRVIANHERDAAKPTDDRFPPPSRAL